MARSTAINF